MNSNEIPQSWLRRSLKALRRWLRRSVHSWLPPFVLGALTLGATFFAWHVVRQNQQDMARAEFSLTAQEYVRALGDRTSRLTSAVDALRAYYVGSDEVSAEEFIAFGASFLSADDQVHSLQWIPRVQAEQRHDFTASARKEIRQNYQILEFSDDGRLVEAGERGEYFPIAFMEATTPAEVAHGFDWGTVEPARRALEQARDRAAPIMTSIVDFPGETLDEPRVFVFAPVYDAPRPPASLEDRREHLLGFVAASARLSRLIDPVLRKAESAGARLYLVDRSPPAPTLLYPSIEQVDPANGLVTSIVGEVLREHEQEPRQRYQVESDFGVAGRKWQLVAFPSPSFVAEQTHVDPNMVLAGGVALTAVVMGFLLALVARSRIISQLVDERTEELQAANDGLTAKTEQLERYQVHLREAKQAAEQASRAKSDLLAHLSHDLRTPLHAVIGFTGLLAKTELDEEQGEYLQTAEQAARRLLELVDRALVISQTEGRLEGEVEQFSLASLVERACRLHREEAEERGLGFELSVSKELPDAVVGDPIRLRQVIDRVVENAVKFTEEGHIEVEATPVETSDLRVCVQFTVRDTGIGVPEDMSNEIFDAFVRAEEPMSRQFSGAGLGLAVAHRLVEQMGGRIWVESTHGEGSAFFFTVALRLIGVDEVDEGDRPDGDGADSPTPPLRLLLVEDSAVNRRLVLRLLGGNGHHIDVAEDGLEAIELFEPGKFDAVLMDMQLPKLSGIEATSRIREVEEKDGTMHTPIIALTAQTLEEEREQILNAGVDEYLPKPLDVGRLRTVIGQLAGRSSDEPSPSKR